VNVRALAGIYLRGLAMGAADVVPGVSGGTIALVTGIYDRLVAAIAGADTDCARRLLAGDVAGAWRRVDGWFMLVLFAGIGSSVFFLAGTITWLLAAYPLLVWSFFFGLVGASGVYLMVETGRWDGRMGLLLIAGAGLALWVSMARPAAGVDSALYIFLCGAIAICAWVLPGISGSFMLLLLGAYAPVMGAVSQLDLGLLVVFAGGCALGILSFARLLSWLLQSRRRPMMALLTGFLFGSLSMVWPWKVTLAWYTAADGSVRPVHQANVWPAGFQSATGQDDDWFRCLLLMLAGAGVVILLHVLGRRAEARS